MNLRQYVQQEKNESKAQNTQQTQDDCKVSQREIVKLRRDNERLKRQQIDLNRYGGSTKAEILRGIDDGKSITELFFIACKGISEMTSEQLFYKTVCSKTQNKY